VARQATRLTFDFSGRVVMLTGAAGDIGWAIASAFALSGATVYALDRDREALDSRMAGASSASIHPGAVDLTDHDDVAASVSGVEALSGGIDILVNNAAYKSVRARIDEQDRASWDQTLAVNLTGAFTLTAQVLPGMRSRQSGVIVNIASQLGHVAVPGSAGYSASKAALIALTRSIALDHAAEGIRAVSLSPGAVLTERLVQFHGSAKAVTDALAPRHPAGRLGTADEVASAVLFLASDQAGFITGTDLVMDGGYIAQ
jgi:NAD(P)-dependent dehydrogenase (short-subunit alcohol dehydrogenase family)